MIWRSAMRTRDKIASHLSWKAVCARAQSSLYPRSQPGPNICPPRSQIGASDRGLPSHALTIASPRSRCAAASSALHYSARRKPSAASDWSPVRLAAHPRRGQRIPCRRSGATALLSRRRDADIAALDKNGKSFWQAHRTRFYQLTTDRGWSVSEIIAAVEFRSGDKS